MIKCSELQSHFSLYYNNQPNHPPTKNTLRWMSFYNEICSKSCCYSPDCGVIRCSSCGISLTTLPPLLRYQCIECPYIPPEAPYNPRPDLCVLCFQSEKVLHQHKKWLEITEKGVHSLIIREKGVMEAKELDLNRDFLRFERENLTNCFICSDKFDEIQPAVKFPGCKKDHGNGVRDKMKGVIDSGEYAHAECLFQWYRVSFREKYCGEAKYCEVCNFNEEIEVWTNEFLLVKEKIKGLLEKDSGDFWQVIKEIGSELSVELGKEVEEIGVLQCVKEKLLEVHLQEWIQKIIKEIF